jgi:hypothetical protein
MNTLATAVLDGPITSRRAAASPVPRHTVPQPVGSVHLWMPWRCRNWPSTPGEERRFVVDLAERADVGVDVEPTRSDITAVLNALRGGLTAAQLIDKAPGLPTTRLLAAYRRLEQNRAAAAGAWDALVEAGGPDALAVHGDRAGVLVPVLVERLGAAAELGEVPYRATVARLASLVATTHRSIDEVEAALAAAPERAVELGAQLYNPYSDSLANRVDHVARRVGMLTPTRVAALLGETANGACPPGQ